MAATGTASTAQQRRSSSWLGLGLALYGAAILAVLTVDSGALAKHLSPRADLDQHKDDAGICKSVDIRNTLESFEKLEGCRVVEGFVQILLFDNVNETLLSHKTFPLLTEITDYLLLYRVNGLRSIGQLFPNLAVIRGQMTFFNYAFVVFEMSSLQEIALYSLTDITRGLIRIDKNPSLCFLNSINWDLIAPESGHFIKSLKPENECPICPGDEKADDETANALKCPKAPAAAPGGTTRNRHLCWNRLHCQKICPAECKHSCNANGQCCSSTCLGGCAVNDTHACTVCKQLNIGSDVNRKCISHCQDDRYKFLERRCVTRSQCINMVKPIDLHSRSDSEHPYKIHEKSCVLQCPTDYMGDNNHTCIQCKGGCKKKCDGGNVDSISLAKQFRGCTHIHGSLEIQIRGGRNVVNELEENLSMIEEIQGYLKVVRSFPLVSLNFLKNLKRIKGDHLESQKYVFVVLDNQNLQDLWDWGNNKTISIERGSLFFHFNPKLCLDKIITLQRKAGLANFTDLEVASNSNGDKIACDVVELEVSVGSTSSKGAILNWKQFDMPDPRKLLGYIVYLIEAPDTHKEIKMYDGRDACGGDGWRLDDVTNTDPVVTHPLLQLKPYTRYAFYVKTYTIAKETKGAQSPIIYFRTQPSVPSGPYRVEVKSNASDALRVTWKPPIRPNGNVTFYFVSGKKQKMTRVLSEQIDYCTTTPKRDVKHNTPDTASTPVTNDTCPCDEKKPSTSSFDDIEESNRIKFEDDLQNEVYVKRAKRETPRETYNTFPNNNFNPMHNSNSNSIENRTEPGTKVWESFNYTTSQTEFYITNLHHYTNYEILVQACREREGPDDIDNNCSNTSPKIERTLAKKDADDIKSVHITNQSSEFVSITWDDPVDPNGEIYSYSIQYKRLDNENSKPSGDCITHNTFMSQNRVHLIKNLLPGNYSVRVCATSAAGFENYSPYSYFYIEESSKISGTVITISVLGVLITAIVCFLFYRKNRADRESIRLIPSVNPEYVPSVYVPDDWEVPRRRVELIRELGQGSFGMVYEGIGLDIRGKPSTRCAVKTVNEHATNRERLEFLNEASVMKAFDTTHVVRLLGVVSQGQPTLVIMELMANGDLKTYLRSHRPDSEVAASTSARQPPSLKQSLQMAIEIADGMAYLAAKKFVHRDLAARNCMVAEDLTVKIGDFGMTRDIYETDYYRKGTKGLLPVRWMAPESLKDGVFTSNSDVWSYGVVLWEMATLASQPYQGLSNDQVLRYVINGGIMERPENCPDKLYALMRECWNHKASARPSFVQLCYWLLEDANDTFAEVSFYHSPAGIEARNYKPTLSLSQDDPSTPLRITGEIDAHFPASDNSDDELGADIDTHITFPPSIPTESKDGIANGYASGCNPKDDDDDDDDDENAATTQC